jgi:two-component system response regulator (stage 0 sporulation protein F)
MERERRATMLVDTHHHDASEEEEPITVRSSRLGRARVLIADDDGDMRDIVSETLRSSGYLTNAAESGFAFIDSIVEIEEGLRPMDGVDLVLVDNRMPGMSGLDALRAMRGADRWVPAILMTAYPSAAVEAEAHRLGAVVLPKPFDRETLRQAVLTALLPRR